MFKKGEIVRINTGPYEGKRALVVKDQTEVNTRYPQAHKFLRVSLEFSRYSSQGIAIDDLSAAEPLSVRGGFDRLEHFQPLLEGVTPLPNWEPSTLEAIAYSITCHGGLVAVEQLSTVRLENDVHGCWSRVYLERLQMGLNGKGIALINRGHGEPVQAGRFAICKHVSRELPGANHSRGWHPAECSVCGMNLSVDSGD